MSEERLTRVETTLDNVERKVDGIEVKVDRLPGRFDGLEIKVDDLGVHMRVRHEHTMDMLRTISEGQRDLHPRVRTAEEALIADRAKTHFHQDLLDNHEQRIGTLERGRTASEV